MLPFSDTYALPRKGSFCVILFVHIKKRKEGLNMKKNQKVSIVLLLCFLLSLSMVGCSNNTTGQEATEESSIWSNATYTEDTEFGEGSTTVNVEVKVNDQSVTFTLHTDKTILGDALMDHELLSGEDGDYGLYIKEVNGITADYDVDKAYRAFYKDGEYMNTGVDGTTIADGEHYELVYTQE